MLAFVMPGPTELLILVAVVCVLFSGRVAALFGGLGRGIHNFRCEVDRPIDNKERDDATT